jgi:hypothetical protein
MHQPFDWSTDASKVSAVLLTILLKRANVQNWELSPDDQAWRSPRARHITQRA